MSAETERLPPERRLRLYLGIARKLRPLPGARNARHIAVRIAWEARHDLWLEALRGALRELNAQTDEEPPETLPARQAGRGERLGPL